MVTTVGPACKASDGKQRSRDRKLTQLFSLKGKCRGGLQGQAMQEGQSLPSRRVLAQESLQVSLINPLLELHAS
jgi:hypothetical protein